MKFGMVYPQTEIGNDPIVIRDYAQMAEALGFSHILAYSHVLGANPDRPGGWLGPYTYQHAFHEPLVLFSFMASVTRKIEFATGVIILPQRQTALFAKQAATLDVLSGGRLRVGIGIGWNQVEYIALNEDFHNRGKRVEEQIELLRLLWTQPLVDYSGRWHTVPDAGLNPLPVQRPIPIWFGGHHEKVLKRMARMGDGWLTNFKVPQDAKPALDLLDQYLEEAGRNRDEFGLEARLLYNDGRAESWQGLIEGWQAAGATHISFNTMGHGFEKPLDHLQAIKTIATELGLKSI